MFDEIQRQMKQAYFLNQQWFKVRNEFNALPLKDQQRLFDEILDLDLGNRISKARTLLNEITASNDKMDVSNA